MAKYFPNCKAKASNMTKSNMHEIVMYTPSMEMKKRQVDICELLSNKSLSSTRKVLYFLFLFDRKRGDIDPAIYLPMEEWPLDC